jgi:beta-carotene hydroxylase
MTSSTLARDPRKPIRWPRARVHLLGRAVVIVLVALSLGAFFITPEGPLGWVGVLTLRTYLMFLATVMGHEASHGNLGPTRDSNNMWGRLALIPTTVPYLNFRKTHGRHHANTNVPEADPDHFIKPNHWWEIPFRSVALPHHWVLWARRHGHMRPNDWLEWSLTYIAYFSLYGAIAATVGPARVLIGLTIPLVLTSILLWYTFAVKTHEGFSTGDPVHRSHNYYGGFAFWLTMGLSMHRAHHTHPGLSWIELRQYVEEHPDGFWKGLLFRRDVQPEPGG